MQVRQKRRVYHALLASMTLTLVAIYWERVDLLRAWELKTLDFRYAHFNRDSRPNPRVVVIDIDEQSLKLLAPDYGRFHQWSRRIYKELIGFLEKGQPAGIFFDILFTERDFHTSGDTQLALASQQAGNVSHAMNLLLDRSQEGIGHETLPSFFSENFFLKISGDTTLLRKNSHVYEDYVLPYEDFLKKIPKIHVVTFHEEIDGVFRRTPLAFAYGKRWLPSLALAGMLSTVDTPEVYVEKNDLKILGKNGQTLRIPFDAQGRMPLHFYRSDRPPEIIPMALVLGSARLLDKGEKFDPAELRVNPLTFKDKVVLVGTSAVGLHDLKATPLDPPLQPGVLLAATAISNVLNQEFLSRAPLGWQWLAVMMLIGIMYGFMLFVPNEALKIGLSSLLLFLYSAAAAWLFQYHSLWIEVAMPLTLGVFAMLDGFTFISFMENAERRRMEGTLSKYLSPSVTKQLIEVGADPRAEVGRQEELSILFGDIRNFTHLSESAEPRLLVSRLNQYLGKATETVFAHSGTLDKFIGDAIMAFWGAPLPDPEHALKSVHCALQLQKEMQMLRQDWKQKYSDGMEFHLGVGINTGKVIVGNIGSEKRLDYTVIGDNVNLASRLEGLTKEYRVSILIGENTQKAIQDKIACRLLDRVKVKGKDLSVAVFEPLGECNDLEVRRTQTYLEPFAKGIEAYQKGHFEVALNYFQKTNETRPGGDGPSLMYRDRCQHLIQNPPENWEGIYVAKTK